MRVKVGTSAVHAIRDVTGMLYCSWVSVASGGRLAYGSASIA